jgi:predicted Zn-dependent peptidase
VTIDPHDDYSEHLDRRIRAIGEGLAQTRLNDGLGVAYQQWPDPTTECTVGLAISIDDTYEDRCSGLAHFAEHVLSRRMREQMPSRVIDSEPRWDAGTSFDSIELVISDLPDDLGRNVAIVLADVARKPCDAVTAAAFAAERAAVLAEFDLIDADWYSEMHRELRRLVWHDSPYRVGDPIGERDEVVQVNAAVLRDYVERVVVPSRCTILYVGKLAPSPEAGLAVLASDLDGGGRPTPPHAG